jgi:hypothetical protein
MTHKWLRVVTERLIIIYIYNISLHIYIYIDMPEPFVDHSLGLCIGPSAYIYNNKNTFNCLYKYKRTDRNKVDKF